MNAAPLLFFSVGPHCLAVRLDEVSHVEARSAAKPGEAHLDGALFEGLGLSAPSVSHRILLAGGGALPSSTAPRAVVDGVAMWPLPPGLTPLGRALGGYAESRQHGFAFVLSSSGLRACLAKPVAPFLMEGFDELE